MTARHLFRLGTGFFVVVIWLLTSAPLVTAAAPEFRLMPDRGTCAPSLHYVAVQSANFPPGMRIVIIAKLPSGTSYFMDYVFNDFVTREGKLPSALSLRFCEPTTPDGTTITFEVWERDPFIPGNIRLGQLLKLVDAVPTGAQS